MEITIEIPEAFRGNAESSSIEIRTDDFNYIANDSCCSGLQSKYNQVDLDKTNQLKRHLMIIEMTVRNMINEELV